MASKPADPPIITAALSDDESAFADLLDEGVEVDAADANGDTALARVAKRALAKRVAHWFSEGNIDGVPVSYTVTDGVMVFRKRNRVVAMKWRSQLGIAHKWCPDLYSYFGDLQTCSTLLQRGASLTSKGKDGKTTGQHLEALKHPFIEAEIADQPKALRKLARSLAGARRRAESAARVARWHLAREAAKTKPKKRGKRRPTKRVAFVIAFADLPDSKALLTKHGVPATLANRGIFYIADDQPHALFDTVPESKLSAKVTRGGMAIADDLVEAVLDQLEDGLGTGAFTTGFHADLTAKALGKALAAEGFRVVPLELAPSSQGQDAGRQAKKPVKRK